MTFPFTAFRRFNRHIGEIAMRNNEDNSVMARSTKTETTASSNPDVVLVGAGIMGATLAVILKELNPKLTIEMYEVLGSAAQESSNAWNNAGTGHAALCELGYSGET
jgi:malate dehydrogenase (quinone)